MKPDYFYKNECFTYRLKGFFERVSLPTDFNYSKITLNYLTVNVRISNDMTSFYRTRVMHVI